MYALPMLLPISPCSSTRVRRSAICAITNTLPWHLTMKRVIHVEPPRINLFTTVLNAQSHTLDTQAKVIRLRPKMAPSLLPTSASSSKTGRAGSLYSFEDSYSRGGNGVEAYTLPKGERGLPLVLRRLGKFKSMVRLLSNYATRSRLKGKAWIECRFPEYGKMRGWEVEIGVECRIWSDDRISNLHSGNWHTW